MNHVIIILRTIHQYAIFKPKTNLNIMYLHYFTKGTSDLLKRDAGEESVEEMVGELCIVNSNYKENVKREWKLAAYPVTLTCFFKNGTGFLTTQIPPKFW